MIHHTYRRLDEPSLQLGPLSLPQWLGIAAIGALCYALKALTGMTTQPFLCIATVAMGGPFAAMALSEGDRPSYTRLVRDADALGVRAQAIRRRRRCSHPLHAQARAAPHPAS